MSDIDRLMNNAVNAKRLSPEGNYTNPRSFGVYRLTGKGNLGRKHRFGNHPVRESELLRDYGECEIVALFLDRDDAEDLAKYLNS